MQVRWCQIGIATGIYILIGTALSPASGETPRNTYVWLFTSAAADAKNLADMITEEFEESLVKLHCLQVIERRQLPRLLAHQEQEKRISSTNALDSASRRELTTRSADSVIFGTITDDVEGGQFKIAVTLQTLAGETLAGTSIRIPRGKRFDAEEREQRMDELASRLCSSLGLSGRSSPPPAKPAPDSTSERNASTSRSSLASEVTVAAHTKAGQRYPLHVRLAELATTAIGTKAKISFTNESSSVLYYKIYYYHQIGGGIRAFDRFSLIGSDGASQEWHEVDGVQEASPMSYFKNACLLLPPSVEVSITFGYEKRSPPGRVVVVHTPVRLSQWAPCPGTEIELPEFSLESYLTP